MNNFLDVKNKGNLKVLLVEPKKSRKYHTPYPPLGLLKLARYHRQKGGHVKLVNCISDDGFELTREDDSTNYVARKWEFLNDSLSELDGEQIRSS